MIKSGFRAKYILDAAQKFSRNEIATIEVFDNPHTHTYITTEIDSTCTEDGSITLSCDACGEILAAEIIPAKCHTYVDGTCSCGDVDQAYVEGLTIAGKNVAFTADYTMVFAVSKANYKAYDEVYLEVQKKLYDGEEEYESATLIETEMMSGMYAFRYKNFAAREIASEVQATVYAKDAEGNVYYGPTLIYSMREYAESRIEKTTNAYFKTMMVDFLNYGAVAQEYFEYNTDDLANKNIDAYQDLATPSRDKNDHRSGIVDTAHDILFTNFNLIFENRIAVVFATNLTDAQKTANEGNLYAKLSYTNSENEIVEVKISLTDENMFVKQEDRWCVQYNGPKMREMSKIITVALYDNDGNAVSNEVTYSIESYASAKMSSDNTELVNLCDAMIKFGDANSAYANNK